jgi:DNA-directed RNA polymerase specialized sigma24 family protein
VAQRTVPKARGERARRRAKEQPLLDLPDAAPGSEAVRIDLGPALDDEIRWLPKRYRLPVILCYLEGKTHTEAAQSVGWPVGTLKGRLARARERLRVCLARRGLAVSAGSLAVAFVENTAWAVSGMLTFQGIPVELPEDAQDLLRA